MTPIISGTSTERIVRSLLLSLFVDVFAVYFLYDGYVGYPQKNALQLGTLLGLPVPTATMPAPNLTAERGRKLAETHRAGEPLEKLSSEFGAPAFQQVDAAYFLGPGGWLKVDLDGTRAKAAKWSDAPHTEADQAIQKFIGWLLVVVGVGATLNVGRVMSTRARLTDEGLLVTGRSPIPFEAMTALRPSNGSSSLDYVQGDRPATLRLDPYIYKNASEIAQAIADRKGFSVAAKS